jgi:uncharacterized protein (DUF427 family)
MSAAVVPLKDYVAFYPDRIDEIRSPDDGLD